MPFRRSQPALGQIPVDAGAPGDPWSQILPFVADPKAVPSWAVPDDAPVLLPGLVTTIARQRGDAVEFLAPAEMGRMGDTDAVHRRARQNARGLPEPRIGADQASPGDPTTGLWAYSSEDPFGAARVAILPEMLALLGPRAGQEAGVLVAVPHLQLLLIHIVYAAEGTLVALKALARLAAEQSEAAASYQASVSPNVFYVDRSFHTQRVAAPAGGTPNLDTGGLLEKTLRTIPRHI